MTSDPKEDVISGPSFGVSENAALVLRWIGHVLLGVMVCLLFVWWQLQPDHDVMLFVTIVISTIGVMCEILGWIGGLSAWLLRCLHSILDHFETERIRRGEAIFGEIALARQDAQASNDRVVSMLQSSSTDGEVDRGRVVALLEQIAGRQVTIEDNQKTILAQQAEFRSEMDAMKKDVATMKKVVCRPSPKRNGPRQRAAENDTPFADRVQQWVDSQDDGLSG